MAQRFPPRQDAAALNCLRNFAEGVAAQPAAYMLSQADVESIGRAVAEFDEAYQVAANLATRSSTDVLVKDETRAQAEALCRHYANLIRVNAGISNAAKIAIGVNPRNHSRTKIFVHQTSPTLTIVAATPGRHTLRYADSVTPTRAAKPSGATGLLLWRAISDEPATDRTTAKYYRRFTRNLFEVAFDPNDRGRTATYWGQWTGHRSGDVGPWSLPVSMAIAA